MAEWSKTVQFPHRWYWWRARRSSPPQPVWITRRSVWLFNGSPLRMKTKGVRTRIYGEFWTTPLDMPPASAVRAEGGRADG